MRTASKRVGGAVLPLSIYWQYSKLRPPLLLGGEQSGKRRAGNGLRLFASRLTASPREELAKVQRAAEAARGGALAALLVDCVQAQVAEVLEVVVEEVGDAGVVVDAVLEGRRRAHNRPVGKGGAPARVPVLDRAVHRAHVGAEEVDRGRRVVLEAVALLRSRGGGGAGVG